MQNTLAKLGAVVAYLANSALVTAVFFFQLVTLGLLLGLFAMAWPKHHPIFLSVVGVLFVGVVLLGPLTVRGLHWVIVGVRPGATVENISGFSTGR